MTWAPTGDEVTGRPVGVVVGGEQHHPSTGQHAEAMQVGPHRFGGHHAGEVVAREDDRPFQGAGGQHHLGGPDPEHAFAHRSRARIGCRAEALHRNEIVRVVASDDDRAGEDGHVGQSGQASRDTLCPSQLGVGEQRPRRPRVARRAATPARRWRPRPAPRPGRPVRRRPRRPRSVGTGCRSLPGRPRRRAGPGRSDRQRGARPPPRSWSSVASGSEYGASIPAMPVGSSEPAVQMPRGRPYSTDRPTTSRPAASTAEASVSPGCAGNGSPSNVTSSRRDRSMRPPVGSRPGVTAAPPSRTRTGAGGAAAARPVGRRRGTRRSPCPESR